MDAVSIADLNLGEKKEKIVCSVINMTFSHIGTSGLFNYV